MRRYGLLLGLIFLAVPLVTFAQNLGKWNAPTSQILLSTELDSLGNNAHSASGQVLTNDVSLAIYGDCEVYFQANAGPNTSGSVQVWLRVAYDGSNYAHVSAETTSSILFVAGLASNIATPSPAEQRVVVRNLVFPPMRFQLNLANHSGVTMKSSGSTVSCQLYHVNTNG